MTFFHLFFFLIICVCSIYFDISNVSPFKLCQIFACYVYVVFVCF